MRKEYKNGSRKSLVSGSMTMLSFLGLLKEKDMYGYEMIDTPAGNPGMYLNLRQVLYIRSCMAWRKKGYLPLTNRNMRERSENITALRKRENRSLPKDGRMAGICLPP